MKLHLYKTLVLLLIPILILSSTLIGVTAQEDMTPREIEAFMDGLFAAQLKSYHVPGAVVSVVKDGEIIFAKGYGYADVERRMSVAAEETLFRVGSVSKLFVWTAVMQLVEQGKIDLNADINTYLTTFKIPSTYEEPVTIMNLMNHNAGFEERAIGESVGSAEDIKPLEEYLMEHMPTRVRAPGIMTAYSNYGVSLAGYIVSQVTGKPYEEYIDENIFKPLNMNRSTFVQPLPEHLQPDMATGYSFEGGRYKAHGFEWKQSAPAGAMSATATDMAHYMIAMLNKGSFQNQRILQTATAANMQQQSFTNDDRVSGIAHGFMMMDINGQQGISHGGVLFQFHTNLLLLPEQNIGIFVAYNGAEGMEAVNNTITSFMDHYYPPTSVKPQGSGLEKDVSKYVGTYMPARHEYTTLGKLVGLMQSITVEEAGKNEIKISLGFPSQLTAYYAESEPGVFRSQDAVPLIYGDIVFGKDVNGNIQYQYQKNNPTTAYIKLPWYAEPGMTAMILGMSLVLFFITLIAAPIGYWIKARRNEKICGVEGKAVIAAILLSFFSLAFVVGFGAIFSKQETVYGLPGWGYIIFFLPYIIALIAAAMGWLTVLLWKRKHWSMIGRVYYTFLNMTAFSFVWWMYYWNLWVMRA